MQYIFTQLLPYRPQNVLKTHQIELARAAAAEEGRSHPRSIAQIRRAKSSMSGIESSAGEEDDNSLGDHQSLAHPTSIARLCPTDSSKAKLNMVCTWSALVGASRTDIVHGQHHFTRLSVRPTTSSRGCPITITCKHPSNLIHDFVKGPLVSIFRAMFYGSITLQLTPLKFGMILDRTYRSRSRSGIGFLMPASTSFFRWNVQRPSSLSAQKASSGLCKVVKNFQSLCRL